MPDYNRGNKPCEQSGGFSFGDQFVKRDLTQQVFGRWTVLRRDTFTGTGKRPREHYLCRCSCPNATERVVCAENLTGGRSQSCGCIAGEINSATKFKDLSGQVFGRLTVLRRAPNQGRQTMFLCRCECTGAEVTVNANSLTRGLTASCGCIRSEVMQVIKRTHGATVGRERSRTYRIWTNMWTRIRNPKTINYHRYGGRGLRVCERWRSFENFLADLGECPSGHTIERVNNSLGYAPGNCIWATNLVQQANRCNNVRLELNGEWAIQAEWARRFFMSDSKLSRWLQRGLSIAQIAAHVGYLAVAIPRKPPLTASATAALHKRKSS